MNLPASNEKLDDLFARYAAGQLSLPMHVLVSAHLAIRQESRNYVSCLESLGAQAIGSCAPLPLSDRDGCLKNIFASREAPVLRSPAQTFMPEPLHKFLGMDLADIKWRRRMPGLKEYTIFKQDGI